MREFGNVTILQSAFLSALKMGDENPVGWQSRSTGSRLYGLCNITFPIFNLTNAAP